MKRLLAVIAFIATSALAQQSDDIGYTKRIRQFTTDPRFMTEIVDHLPASATIPTPLKFNGYIAGAEGHLTYAEDVYRYMRALEAASPRVKVFSIGKSEEGREMMLVAVSSEANIARLDRYREITRLLSDPRKITDDQARALIAEGEHYREQNPSVPTPPLIYWGHYVAHDNNRDNLGLALDLSRNVMQAYFDFHPQVLHDLHESLPSIDMSTGTGPYNPSLDPLMIDEWHRMAYHEVDELTRRGRPGAWTHGFHAGQARGRESAE